MWRWIQMQLLQEQMVQVLKSFYKQQSKCSHNNTAKKKQKKNSHSADMWLWTLCMSKIHVLLLTHDRERPSDLNIPFSVPCFAVWHINPPGPRCCHRCSSSCRTPALPPSRPESWTPWSRARGLCRSLARSAGGRENITLVTHSTNLNNECKPGLTFFYLIRFHSIQELQMELNRIENMFHFTSLKIWITILHQVSNLNSKSNHSQINVEFCTTSDTNTLNTLALLPLLGHHILKVIIYIFSVREIAPVLIAEC